MKVALIGDTTGSVYIILSVTWLGYTKVFHLQLLGKRGEYTAQIAQVRDAYENELRPVPDDNEANLGQGGPPPPGANAVVAYRGENGYDRDRYGYETAGGETGYKGSGYQADAVSGYKQSDDRGGHTVAKGLGRSEEVEEKRERGGESGKSRDGKKKSHGGKEGNGKVKEKKKEKHRGH
jgi:hypothetical protein